MTARLPLVVLAVALLIFGGAAPAAACLSPNWVEVEVDSDAVDLEPGVEVGLAGGGYSPGPVTVRWNTRTGQVLAVAEAGGDGAFTTRITIPEAGEGVYAVVATQQKDADGHQMWGFTDVVVTSAAAAPRSAPTKEPSATPTAGGPSTYVVLVLLLVAGATATLALVVGNRRRADRAALDVELAHLLADTEQVPVTRDT